MTTNLDHAMTYAGRGWPVFPLRHAGKEPDTAHGFKDATTEAGQLRSWWGGAGTARGIGLATGAPSGVWVLDLDGQPGLRSVQALEATHGALPTTLCTRTGGGGLHLFWRMPAGRAVRNRTAVEPGIDVRGTGGYVVLPPSGHPSGQAYAWVDEAVEVAEAPGWLLDLVAPLPRPAPPPAPQGRSGGSGPATVTNPRAYARAALARAVDAVRGAGEGGRNDTLNREAHAISRFVSGGWLARADVEADLQLAAEGVGLKPAEARKTIASALGAARSDLPEVAAVTPLHEAPAMPAVLAVADPLAVAGSFLDTQLDELGRLTLRRWRGDWYRWDGAAYGVLEDEALDGEVWRHSAGLFMWTKDGPKPYSPTASKISNVKAALRALEGVLVDGTVEPPCWVGEGAEGVAGAHVVPVANGLLDLLGRRLIPATPNLFAISSIPVAWDPDVAEPRAWLDFLGALWPEDQGEAGLLQRWFGYVLTPDTSQQKMLMITGPRRSGKGTIARTLHALVGKENFCGPTLSGLATPFGLQPLLGRLVGVIADARLSARTDQAVVVERLLSVTGEDGITIDRKHKDQVTVKLPTRLVLMSNEVPRLADASGALASRMLFLPMRASFLGREDLTLGDRLAGEMQAILRWAVEGWHLLRAERRFPETSGTRDGREAMTDLSSPISTFVNDACRVGDPDIVWCEIGALYAHYREWAERQGLHPCPLNWFARDLASVLPDVRTERVMINGQRTRYIRGITTPGPFDRH